MMVEGVRAGEVASVEGVVDELGRAECEQGLACSRAVRWEAPGDMSVESRMTAGIDFEQIDHGVAVQNGELSCPAQRAVKVEQVRARDVEKGEAGLTSLSSELEDPQSQAQARRFLSEQALRDELRDDPVACRLRQFGCTGQVAAVGDVSLRDSIEQRQDPTGHRGRWFADSRIARAPCCRTGTV